ncbi:Clampless protein 1 [Vanrija pseudolonga]|uniref:Clampless protein 1 n=1 Tax=Vanrija pseudolonga TaxID=143232 RepID=A0AAF0YB23_9TREE|nr:Clampless protein 1 [Vanrija pseudolonga]
MASTIVGATPPHAATASPKIPTTPRISSNKENGGSAGSVATPSPARKGALRGLGAPSTPKRKAAKPYDRKSSVTRAKLSEAREVKLVAAAPEPTPELAQPTAHPKPAAAAARTITQAIEQTKSHLLGPPCLRFTMAGKAFTLPKVLPRPAVAPVNDFVFGDTKVPAAYVLDCVRETLPEFLATANEYRPYPDGSAGPAWRPTIRFGLPRLIEEEVNADVAEYIATRCPDMAIAFATSERAGASMRVVPAKSLAFAAQCAYFPKVLPELEEVDTSEPDLAPHSTPTLVDDSDDESDASEADFVIEPFVHLPLHKLVLPAPAAFDLLSARLHHTSGKWQASLLGLPASSIPTPSAAGALLAHLSAMQLKARLDTVFGVWMNMVALGVDDDAMWNELGGAWNVLVLAFVGSVAGVAAETRWA